MGQLLECLSLKDFYLQLLSTLAMMSHTLAHAIHTHYKIRRQAENPYNKNCDDIKTVKVFKKLNTCPIVQGLGT